MILADQMTMTPFALEKLRSILSAESSSEMALRLQVSPGGCAGYQYGMLLDDQIGPHDSVTSIEGIKVVVDEDSAPYVLGAEIDYVDGLMGAGFTVHNPNAVRSCSCGHSFDAGDGTGCPKSCS